MRGMMPSPSSRSSQRRPSAHRPRVSGEPVGGGRAVPTRRALSSRRHGPAVPYVARRYFTRRHNRRQISRSPARHKENPCSALRATCQVDGRVLHGEHHCRWPLLRKKVVALATLEGAATVATRACAGPPQEPRNNLNSASVDRVGADYAWHPAVRAPGRSRGF